MLVHWIMEDHPVGLGCGVDTGGELCSTTQDLVTCPAEVSAENFFEPV